MKYKKYRIVGLSIFLLVSACNKDIDPIYRQRMREFITSIADYARNTNPDFLIVPQNGVELVTDGIDEPGAPSIEYLDAIDGNGQEDLFYGYDRDNKQTPGDESDYLIDFLNISKDRGNSILVTDYCSSAGNMDDSYAKNYSHGYVSFAASHRELDIIPTYPGEPYHSNSDDIETLEQVKNFLYLIDPQNFSSKTDFIQKVGATNYDLIIMDLFFDEGEAFNSTEIQQLKTKANGGKRLVVCYMSIGEAEDYRYYWQSSWRKGNPAWLDKENRQWEGNYKVHYWDPGWQSIIFGNNTSYAKKILDAGFDGAYLDIIEAFEYYE
jgi:cysteinyl-tRNA synthetase, unknown class